MGVVREVIDARVSSLVDGSDAEDTRHVSETVVTALVALCRSLRCDRLRAIVANTTFPQIAALKNLSGTELEFLDREVKLKEVSTVKEVSQCCRTDSCFLL
jgi:hypothetical protein